MIARALVVVALAASTSFAEPRRVLVVDGDSELVRAIETSLAPWKLVVIAQNDGVDPSLVASRALEADAQFIVWREGAELLVYDRDRDVTERRPAKSGSMDPVAAAGAALTVKTMMRLPDPTEETAPSGSAIVTVASPLVDEGDTLRIAAGIGVDTIAALRGTFGVVYRPMKQLRLGGAFEIASQDLDQSGFKGTARDYALLATASWTIPALAFEIEPWLAAGALIDIVEGKHAQQIRHETAVVPTARVGVSLWWWHQSQLGLGLTAGAALAVGTPTYTRDPQMPMKAVIYDMPPVGGVFSLVAAWRH